MALLTINHNLMALSAFNNLTRTYGTLAKSVDRLSSGLRINSAADDAAGLAIRELMRSDIAVLNQGVRNANDAISLLQTMDGACQIIDEKLIRMKELAEQAATGTYSDLQRQMMHSEFDAMRKEIERIAQATDFNGMHLLNSSAQIKIHFGTGSSSAEDYYYITAQNVTSSALGISDLSLLGQDSAQAALSAIDAAILTKDAARAHFGGMMNRLQNTVINLTTQAENLQAAESQISDVDVAHEMTIFVNNQIKAQAAVAMLAQANSMPQMALTLLGAA
jgi:flagellin